jgi:hypothetical protein
MPVQYPPKSGPIINPACPRQRLPCEPGTSRSHVTELNNGWQMGRSAVLTEGKGVWYTMSVGRVMQEGGYG